MINAGFPPERSAPPIAAYGAGVAVAWLAGELSRLLVAITGISILVGIRARLLSAAIFGPALTTFLLAGSDALDMMVGGMSSSSVSSSHFYDQGK